MLNYLNKRQDNNVSNICKFVVDRLIMFLLLFMGDEYQGHVAEVEVIAM